MTGAPLPISSCPKCDAVDLVTEPAVDEEGLPTGLALVSCPACGWALGELPPPPPSPEAEPEPVVESGALLPTEDVLAG